MKLPSRKYSLAAALAFAAATLFACGPFFPNTLLTGGDSAVLVAPVADFTREIKSLIPLESKFKYLKTTPDGGEMDDAEASDLQQALTAAGVAKNNVDAIVAHHREQRRKLNIGAAETDPDADAEIEADDLPREFLLYHQGAARWHKPDGHPAACGFWEQLLALPARERQYKSTWAAYMLGLAFSSVPEKRPDALASFQKVRALAEQGFADSIGLAAASYGQEALLHLLRGELIDAADLYLHQASTGDPTAIESLRLLAAQAFRRENPSSLVDLAQNPRTRELLTAYLISGRAADLDKPDAETPVARWLAALESTQIHHINLAEKLALAAYQSGEIDLARRWLALASPHSFAVRWLRAKILLYEGRLQPASELLASLAAEFPALPALPAHPAASPTFGENLLLPGAPSGTAPRQLHAESGILHLARREYTQALHALLPSGYWIDAAYIAERVLTTAELKSYVDQHWPEPKPPAPGLSGATPDGPARTTRTSRDIRYLLARRLAREGEYQAAAPYFPQEYSENFATFADLRAAGANPHKAAPERARCLFHAARIMRHHGLELFGTETAPDWRSMNGQYQMPLTPDDRALVPPADATAPAKEELVRAYRHAPEHDTRFHYRYTAADLAFQAAQLLPDNDNQTAIILCTAGSWIKNLDPKAADPFYKALVRRCRKTRIGREADQIRWFPPIDQQGNILPRPAPQGAPLPPPEVTDAFPSLALAP